MSGVQAAAPTRTIEEVVQTDAPAPQTLPAQVKPPSSPTPARTFAGLRNLFSGGGTTGTSPAAAATPPTKVRKSEDAVEAISDGEDGVTPLAPVTKVDPAKDGADPAFDVDTDAANTAPLMISFFAKQAPSIAQGVRGGKKK